MSIFRKTPSITQIILAILYQAGAGTIKSFFPHPYYHFFCNHKSKKSFRPAITRLKQAGLIKKDASDIFRLTNKGEKEAFFSFINAEASYCYSPENTKKTRWDGKWRIILFDVPEKKKHQRHYLRSVIKTLGFKEFQKSVWVYPHKVPSFLVKLLAEESILPYTRFITTNSIDYDKDLKNLFFT